MTNSDRLESFKHYLRKNPELIKKVRQHESSWQELYEEWLLLGEDSGQKIEFDQLFSTMKEKLQHFDPSQIEEYSKKLQSGLDFFQEMLNHFNREKEAEHDILMKQWKQ
ncbi:hypothetical protein JMA_15640 [Jeotgalibacillus malaysiensis]|uniref:Cytosolic protein n=1 Tax=Jeotgalibacillus malaysiensis TaxID=1508404 RepID=A0A0B5ALB2_9BACL|nr:spore coat protein YlbD [Jeotgalibacillus malaysiensis]AJD90881.1 hypothetical protein JMA_15640 [Jeotgalibacillus malaysiensis]